MGGKHYVEGDVDATIVGTAIMWEDANNVMRSVSAAKPLPMADGVTGAALGTTTDAAASAAVDEDATARTGISLWKGIKNLLIDLKGLLSGGLPAALAAGGGLKVEGVAGGVAQPVSVALPTTIAHGQKTIAAAGTEEALGSSTALISGVRVKALHGNTGWVYVGANPVTLTTGFVLDAGEEVFIEVADLATVYIDVSVNGEGVSYIGS